VPTRKQRRREAKIRRHDWEEVYVDAEGREVPAEEAAPAARNGRRDGRRQTAKSTSQGRARGVQPPSWRRVLKRGAIFAPLMFLTVHLIAGDDLTMGGKLVQTAFLLLVFMPFSYFMDTMTYRMSQRRLRGGSSERPPGRRS